jgi:hypothetical protein
MCLHDLLVGETLDDPERLWKDSPANGTC